MKEDRRGKAYGIQAIENAAVSFNGGTEIFYAAVSLDGGHHQSSGKAQQGNQQ